MALGVGPDRLLGQPSTDLVDRDHGVSALVGIRTDHDHDNRSSIEPVGREGPRARRDGARLNSARQRRAAGSYEATDPAGSWAPGRGRTTREKPPATWGSEETSEPRPGTSDDGIDAKKVDAALRIPL